MAAAQGLGHSSTGEQNGIADECQPTWTSKKFSRSKVLTNQTAHVGVGHRTAGNKACMSITQF